MKQKEYIKKVTQNLTCPNGRKKEIQKELTANIATAIGAGETWEAIQERMGKPEQVAQEFNENLSGGKPGKGKTKTLLIVLGSVLGVLLILGAAGFWILPKNIPLEKSSIFQEAEVEAQADYVIELLNQSEYEDLAMISTPEMQTFLRDNSMDDAKAMLGTPLGEYRGNLETHLYEMRQMGKRYATARILASYENRSVWYTITFDTDMKLTGLYMQ